MDDQMLRREVKWLGVQLGEVLKETAGHDAFELVEDVRGLARQRRDGDAQAETALTERIASLDPKQTTALARALSIFFDLANIAEDRHRVRVLREREREMHPDPRPESIGAAIAELKRQGVKADVVSNLLDRLMIELVFTAHPTEAKRRSLREKSRDLRDHLYALDHSDLLPRERKQLEQEVRGDLTALWQTDFLRERRPTVFEEVERGLFFFGNLWDVVPQLHEEMDSALRANYPEIEPIRPPFLRFGSWIGGDRDGHPNVTTEVTAETLRRLRQTALARHYQECRRLRRGMSVSQRMAPVTEELLTALDEAQRCWPEVVPLLEPIAPPEIYRRYLRVVQWRVEQTQTVELRDVSGSGEAGSDETGEDWPRGGYRSPDELLDDLSIIRRSLLAQPGGSLLCRRVDRWMRQTRVFGFHAMRLDIRQESSWYHRVLAELLHAIGAADSREGYLQLDEDGKREVLTRTMSGDFSFDTEGLSDETLETLQLFRLLAKMVRVAGSEALGAQVISMTHHVSDVLAVLWLLHWAARHEGLEQEFLPMPIVPLFETIDDLERSHDVLTHMLAHPIYRQHVERHGNQQTIMIGYSDSTKDGGYLAACWYLFEAQVALQQTAEQHGVRTVFFHGRGGSLGRGGGPAARGILSLPRNTVDGALRMTEQGEVLAARYDDPHVAYRHLEQVTWATLLISARSVEPPRDEWMQAMDALAKRALRAYRELVDQPGFIEYFQHATPIEEIENLPIGSRPARRGGQRTLGTLRAIPWVFSWTQNRHLIPAWYGLGAAMAGYIDEAPDGLARLRAMYADWPFFTGTIDNAEMALAKSDLDIGRHYADLVPDGSTRESIWTLLRDEYQRSVDVVLQITQRDGLLAKVPWLRRSIDVRNPYVDPLNLIQVEQFRRLRRRKDDGGDEERSPSQELIRLSIQGIAAGLRTTG